MFEPLMSQTQLVPSAAAWATTRMVLSRTRLVQVLNPLLHTTKLVEAPTGKMPGMVMLKLQGNACGEPSSVTTTPVRSACPSLVTVTDQTIFEATRLVVAVKECAGVLPLTETNFSQAMLAGFT